MTMAFEDVCIAHFSSKVKPSHWFVQPFKESYDSFVQRHIVEKIQDQICASPSQERVRSHLQRVTSRATAEWKQCFHQMEAQHPEIHSLLQKAKERNGCQFGQVSGALPRAHRRVRGGAGFMGTRPIGMGPSG